MVIRGKVIGGLIGLMIGGPLGALLGIWIGHKSDRKKERRLVGLRYGLRSDGVAAAVVVLGAKLAKSDGVVSHDEVQVFRRMFHIPDEDVPMISRLWRQARETPAGYEPYARQLARVFKDEPSVLRQIHALLYRIADADGAISTGEAWMLEDIARIFGVPDAPRPSSAAPAIGHIIRASDIERAAQDIFSGGGMGHRALGLGGRDDGATSLEERAKALLSRPWPRPVLAFGVAASLFVLVSELLPVGGLFYMSDILIGFFVAAIGFNVSMRALPKPPGPEDELAKLAEQAQVDPDEVLTALQEIEAEISALRRIAAGLDELTQLQVEEICGRAKAIMNGFRKDPGDVPKSRPFLLHYLRAAKDVLARYADLRRREPSGERVAAFYEKIEPLLADIDALFRKHHERNLADEALELDVSIDSLRRMVKTEGA